MTSYRHDRSLLSAPPEDRPIRRPLLEVFANGTRRRPIDLAGTWRVVQLTKEHQSIVSSSHRGTLLAMRETDTKACPSIVTGPKSFELPDRLGSDLPRFQESWVHLPSAWCAHQQKSIYAHQLLMTASWSCP
jgi:hypothetical protein